MDSKAAPEHQALLNVANNKGITPLMVMICAHLCVGLLLLSRNCRWLYHFGTVDLFSPSLRTGVLCIPCDGETCCVTVSVLCDGERSV